MKYTILIAMMAVSILTAGCGKKSGTSAGFTSPAAKKGFYDWIGQVRGRVAKSQMVAYCTADTNSAPKIVFTVSEIWKGAHDATTLGITNGTQFPFLWGKHGQAGATGPLPDAAILIVSPTASRETALDAPNLTFIRDGRVGTSTLQEFKSEVGLR